MKLATAPGFAAPGIAAPSFEAMRADLIARGLLTADFRLTEAGNAHVDRLQIELETAEAPEDSGHSGVRWNTGQRLWGMAA